jgi:hypothetical protein
VGKQRKSAAELPDDEPRPHSHTGAACAGTAWRSWAKASKSATDHPKNRHAPRYFRDLLAQARVMSIWSSVVLRDRARQVGRSPFRGPLDIDRTTFPRQVRWESRSGQDISWRVSGASHTDQGAIMGFGISLLLMAIGAVLAFAVHATVSGISIVTVGWILIAVGALGLLASTIVGSSWGRGRNTTVIEDDRRHLL